MPFIGLLISFVFLGGGLVCACMIERIKKRHDLVSFKEIMAFTNGEDVEGIKASGLTSLSRKHPALSIILKGLLGAAVGIALGSATVAAEALGLSTCCVGAAREIEPEMSELLQLPRYVFPVCGFCIGHATNTPDLKPRLPERAVLFQNHYDPDLKPVLADYDEAYRHYLTTRSSNQKDGTWTQEVASYYTIPYTRYEDIPEMLRNKGFGFEK